MKIIKIIPLIALPLCLLSGTAKAQEYSQTAGPDTIGTISVFLNDAATDACWTNLREVREYAEEKLKIKGYEVVPEDGNYEFMVAITAFRNSKDWCIYTVGLQIFRPGPVQDGVGGVHEIGTYRNLGQIQTNANNKVISSVQKMIDKM